MTQAQALASIQGRAARARGESLELDLDAYHATLAARGLAWVRRVGTPTKVLGKTTVDARGRTCFRAAYTGRQGADFVGQDFSGNHICIEAKSHAGPDAWDSGIAPPGDAVGGVGIMPAQWAELCRAAFVPSSAIGLVVLRAWGSTWAIHPAEICAHVIRVGRRTIRPGEASSVGTEIPGVAWGVAWWGVR